MNGTLTWSKLKVIRLHGTEQHNARSFFECENDKITIYDVHIRIPYQLTNNIFRSYEDIDPYLLSAIESRLTYLGLPIKDPLRDSNTLTHTVLGNVDYKIWNLNIRELRIWHAWYIEKFFKRP